ncbi:hypothetical protein F5Y07DRAFT_409348 [Xylaria sp. FL0933]|nr:hypothetical protein F5Y07DRAFT_409348 [Xylaria sp. FL0933]
MEPRFYRKMEVDRDIDSLSDGIVSAPAVSSAFEERASVLQLKSRVFQAPKTYNTCIHQMFEARAHTQPEKVAVSAWDGQFTYTQLDVLSTSLATRLAQHGVGPETYVPICAEKSCWVPVAMLAVLKAGGAFVLLDPTHPVDRLKGMCRIVGATRIIASNQTAEIAKKLAPKIFNSCGYDPAQLPTGAINANPGNVAYAIFTSGSSGRPKAVAIEHRAFCSSAMAHAAATDMSAESRVLQFASYAFDACLTEILTALLVGACVCVPSDEGLTNDLVGEVHRLRPNWALLTPSIARILDVADFSMLRTLVLGGEAINENDVHKWAPNLSLYVAYGVSEAAVINLVRSCSVGDIDHASLGFGVGVECWLVDPDNHERLATVGAVGELLLEGPTLGREYIGESARTEAAFIDPPPWHRRFTPGSRSSDGKLYKTGDLCMCNPVDSSIRYIGRKDDQRKFHGKRLEMAELEHHLRSLLPDAPNLAVDSVKSHDVEVLVAFILLRAHASSRHADTSGPWLVEASDDFRARVRLVQKQLQGAVPKWMIPSHFLPLKHMPLLPSGKIDRQELRSLAATMTQERLLSYGAPQILTAKPAPSTQGEKLLQQLWASVLRIPAGDIGLDDNFTELGGTSIHLMRLAGAARQQGFILSLGDVLRRGSLAEMAASLTPAPVEAETPVQPFSLIPPSEDRDALIGRAMQTCQLRDRRDIEDLYPCTPLQEGLLSLTAKRPGAYTVAFEYELPPSLDVQRFRRAWNAVVVSNPILRTRFFQSAAGSMYQVILRDVMHVSWESEKDTAASSCQAIISNTWVLGGAMVRLCLHPPDSCGASCRLVLAIHHALCDGWSLPLILQQLQSAYLDGIDSLPPRPFNRFIDYISRASPNYEAFWSRYFAGVQAAAFPSLPSATYIPNPTARTAFAIQIDSYGKGEFSVPNRLKLAWSILISLYTDNPDTVFGLTVAGRGAPVLGIQETTGPTIASIPYRLHLQLDGTIGDTLQRVQEDAVSLVPFEQAGLQHISRMSPDATSACSAFQSLLVIQPQPDEPPELFRTAQGLAAADAFSTYAVTLICRQAAGSVEIDATFDPDIIDETQFHRMLQQMRHIFQQLHPGQTARTIHDLDVTSPEDWAELTVWNNTLPEAIHACAHDLIREQSMLRPEAPAICAWDGQFTYGEMEELSSNMAAYLVDQGIGPEMFIPLCFEKTRWTTIAMIAVIKAGGAFILLDPSHPFQRLRDMCNIAKAPFVISSEQNADLAAELAPRSLVVGADWKPWESPGTLSSMPHRAVSPDSSIYVVFTSGSTGTPKGTIHSHKTWCTSAQANRVGLYLDASSRVFQFAAYAFDISIADNLLTLVAGGCICVPKHEEIQKGNLVKEINDLDANWVCLTPSIARTIDPSKVPNLKKLLLCGEPIAPEVISSWSPHTHLLNVYGPAECAILTTLHRNVRDYKEPNNIGFPTSAVCWVVDAQNQQRLAPIGVVGQLLVESPIVGHGYLNNPGQSAGSFVVSDDYPTWLAKFRPGSTNRLYLTGDLVQYTKDGSLRYVGRLGTQIKLRGQRIELAEIEYALRKCLPEAQEAIVEVITRRQSAALTAFILLKPQILRISDERFQALAAQATAQLELLLPHYMIPSFYVPIDQIPYSKSGKLDRKLLRDLAAELPTENVKPADTTQAMPISEEEVTLRSLFSQALKIPPEDLSASENFVRLGGDSIVAMSLVAMAKDVGLMLSVADIFKNPTISSLAKTVKRFVTGVDHQIHPLSLIPDSADRMHIEKAAVDQCRVNRDQIEDIYPCTALQEGLMSLSVKIAGTYIAKFRYVIPRVTDLSRFQHAWNQALRANSILRTRFIQPGDYGVFQVVLKDSPRWKFFRSVDEQENKSEPEAMGLGTPLVYLSMAPSDDASGGHHFHLTIHHSLYDGWSLQLIWEQVLKAYQGEEPPPRPFNYFIREAVLIEGVSEFWRADLSNLNAAQFPVLPYADYSPTPNQSFSHSVTNLPLSKGDCTLTTIIQLAWAVVVSHYTDSDDVVFGVTSDGRSAAVDGIAEVTGPTIATVPLRVLLDSNKTVADSLQELQDRTIAMVPFLQSGLHNIRRISEDTAKGCRFQSQLVVQPPGVTSGIDLRGIAKAEQENLEDYKAFSNYAFVMLCHMEEGSNNLLIWVNYDSGIIQKREAQRLVEQFHNVLYQLFVKQSLSIREVEVISKEDMAQLAIWHGQLPSATSEALHNLVLEHCHNCPDAEAICSWDGKLTYRQLEDLSARLAQHLLTFCHENESKIAVCLEKSCWSIVALLAVLRSGCACVLVDPGHPRLRTEQIIEMATPDLMLVSVTHQKRAHGLVRRTVCIDSTFIQSLPLLGTALPTVAPDQAAFILFTSGTTGTAKGIVMEHVNLSTSIAQAGVEMGFTPQTRCLHFASYAFDASIYEIFNTLGFGGCLCVVSEYDRMNNLTSFISDQRINLAILTPSTVTLLQPEDVPTLKTLVVGGEALTLGLVDLWADKVSLINGYGPAEATVCCVVKVPATGWKYGTIGHMVGSCGWIVDRSNSKLAAIGSVGELIIEGPVVTRGYLKEPEKTDAAYIRAPSWLLGFRSNGAEGRLYKSGDLVQYNLDGTIRFFGRIEGQAKLRGQRISIEEAEYHVKRSLPVIAEVVAEVIVPPGEGRTPFLVACILMGERSANTAECLFREPTRSFREMVHEARVALSNSIPSYMVPEAFLPLNRLPLTRSGKLDRRQIREACGLLSLDRIYEYSAEAKVAKRAPSTSIERTLQRIWAQVLNVEASSIGVDDNWMRLGGDSIQAMRVVTQCAAAGLRTSVAAIFHGKTIAQMSLRTEHMDFKPTLEAEQLNFLFDLSPIQQMFFSTADSHYHHFNQSLSCRLSKQVSFKAIQRAVRWIVQNHSMLRARFIQISRGRWKQMITDDTDKSYTCRESRIESRDEAAPLLQRDQEDLNIQHGPLFICHLLHDGRENHQYLSLTAHHLIVDIVSWQILLSDLNLLLEGQQTPVPPSLSFQNWSRLQAEYAAKHLSSSKTSPAPASKVPAHYWEFDLGSNRWEDVIEEGFILGEQETQALLGNANDALGTKPVEILHAVLLQAFARVFDRPVPTVFSEGHGREPWDSSVDPSGTVGWFTTIWPADVSVQPEDGLLDIIQKTKDARRGVKSNGWAYFTSQYYHPDNTTGFRGPLELLFNYNPGFVEDNMSLLQPFALTDVGLCQISPKMVRFSLIDVLAGVHGSRMSFNFIYNRHMRSRRSSIREWIKETKDCLEAAAVILTRKEPSHATSDFPLLNYSSVEMETFRQKVILPLAAGSFEIGDAYKCSPIQNGIVLSQAKVARRYIDRFRWSVKTRNGSQVHSEKLQEAWQKVLQRHPILRTVIYENPGRGGGYYQLVLKTVPADMSVILPVSDDPGRELERHKFDIAPLTPPHRLAIGASHTGSVECLLEINHAIVDGYSRQLLLRDLSLAYEGMLDVTPLHVFRDYVEYIDALPMDAARSYWDRYLRSVEPCKLLSSPPCVVPKDLTQILKLSLPFGQELRDFCSQQELTLSNIFQLAWALVLRLYANSESVCFGYMTSGRDVPVAGIDETVGPIINMHICHIILGPDQTVLELLLKNQHDFVESLTYQHLSITDKVRSTDIRASALFNTIMSVQTEGEEREDQSALIFGDFRGVNETEYDMVLNIGVLRHEIDISWEYSATFMSEEQVCNIADAFREALLNIMSHPHQQAMNISLFGALSKHRVGQYNKHEALAIDQRVENLIEKRCVAQPSAIAVDAWDGCFTYEEIDKLSSLLASKLRDCGVGPNKLVPLCFDRSRWTPVALLGVLKAGGAFILLDFSHPIARLQEVCKIADAFIVLASEHKRKLAAQLCPHILIVDERIASGESQDARTGPDDFRDLKDIAYLIFTSGSTGKPKGVMISHGALATSAVSLGDALHVNARSRVLQFASYAFDAAVLEHITSLIMGACICIPSDTERHDIPRAVAVLEANWMLLTPALARALDPSDFTSTMHTVVIAGDVITEKELNAWRAHVNLLLAYGLTECTIISFVQPVNRELSDGRILGRSINGNGWIVNPHDSNQLVPVGSVGELLIEGPVVGLGYLNDPKKTADAFIEPPPWLAEVRGNSARRVYKTGDLVKYNADGTLYYISRKDTQVKLRGQRVSLCSVEHDIRQCYPLSTDAVVELVEPENRNRGPFLVAFIYTRAGEPTNSTEILALPSPKFSLEAQEVENILNERLPTYMVPTLFLPVQRMPVTVTGKVDRHVLRQTVARLSQDDLLSYRALGSELKSPPLTKQNGTFSAYSRRLSVCTLTKSAGRIIGSAWEETAS